MIDGEVLDAKAKWPAIVDISCPCGTPAILETPLRGGTRVNLSTYHRALS